jgi:hypothetical protein
MNKNVLFTFFENKHPVIVIVVVVDVVLVVVVVVVVVVANIFILKIKEKFY